jgi:hypothetical protein
MKFLLQEKRLSEEHLDAIWAAIEKPDQFETVGNDYIVQKCTRIRVMA